eukprot:5960213-Prymnesium_polylepis.2
MAPRSLLECLERGRDKDDTPQVRERRRACLAPRGAAVARPLPRCGLARLARVRRGCASGGGCAPRG